MVGKGRNRRTDSKTHVEVSERSIDGPETVRYEEGLVRIDREEKEDRGETDSLSRRDPEEDLEVERRGKTTSELSVAFEIVADSAHHCTHLRENGSKDSVGSDDPERLLNTHLLPVPEPTSELRERRGVLGSSLQLRSRSRLTFDVLSPVHSKTESSFGDDDESDLRKRRERGGRSSVRELSMETRRVKWELTFVVRL